MRNVLRHPWEFQVSSVALQKSQLSPFLPKSPQDGFSRCQPTTNPKDFPHNPLQAGQHQHTSGSTPGFSLSAPAVLRNPFSSPGQAVTQPGALPGTPCAPRPCRERGHGGRSTRGSGTERWDAGAPGCAQGGSGAGKEKPQVTVGNRQERGEREENGVPDGRAPGRGSGQHLHHPRHRQRLPQRPAQSWRRQEGLQQRQNSIERPPHPHPHPPLSPKLGSPSRESRDAPGQHHPGTPGAPSPPTPRSSWRGPGGSGGEVRGSDQHHLHPPRQRDPSGAERGEGSGVPRAGGDQGEGAREPLGPSPGPGPAGQKGRKSRRK
ncbi:uncharacterized protein LOC141731879 isoform X2 [Zonotrichia albicollis]|uniref:uncharacterized protein LOC141731879 isoform X2 n=1 Tax=Zonotrichia albicollis TaxID=44394 RepID=UPI003D80BA32